MLNRCPLRPATEEVGEGGQDVRLANRRSMIRVMMYIFPRQFGLHNVFTSTIDFTKTSQRFQDYTMREEEIAGKFGGQDAASDSAPLQVPKRLRGTLWHIIERLLVRHRRCSYSELLHHYCPVW